MRSARRLLVLGAAVAAMGAFAAPANAGTMSGGGPPNCEKGQLHAAINAVKHENWQQAFKHFKKFVRCHNGEVPGHRPGDDGYGDKFNTPPNCEKGQLHAAFNAFKRHDWDQAWKHFEKAYACHTGESPGGGHHDEDK